jgi:shikimate dehydrogenase
MFEQAFAHHKLDWRYLTFEVSPERLGEAVGGLRALGFRGGHCAEPHRQAIVSLLDRTTETAATLGSVNLLYRDGDALVGDNTEGKGVLQAIQTVLDPAGKNVVLLGAGQAARAVALELVGAGIAHLTVVNRTESHAAELLELLADKCHIPIAATPWAGDYSVPPETDILIHATSQDRDAVLPILLDSLQKNLLVADLTVGSPRTWLLSEADERACQTVDGLTMFIERVAAAFQMWTTVDPDRNVLREAVEEFLDLE